MVTSHSHCQPWVTLGGLKSQSPDMATSAVPQSRPQVQDLADDSQLIKAHILMSHVSREAAPCRLHHPRKLCCSHGLLWDIILLLPPFSRAGGNLHCFLSAVYHCQTWLTLQEQRQLFCWAGISLPPLQGCMDVSAFLSSCPQATSKPEPAPGKSLSQFALVSTIWDLPSLPRH